jgi:hypothetical protein
MLLKAIKKDIKMDFTKYIPYDAVPIKPKKPKISPNATTSEDHRKYADELEQYEKNLKKFEESLAIYYQEENNLKEQFWKDAFEKIGIPSNHPKASRMRILAWEYGHSSGYEDIFSHLNDIWIVVKD